LLEREASMKRSTLNEIATITAAAVAAVVVTGMLSMTALAFLMTL
jgi:hypothetical protein